MIKITKKRAEISSNFIDLMLLTANKKKNAVRKEIERGLTPPQQRTAQAVLGNIKQLSNKDYTLTQLRSLEATKFDAVQMNYEYAQGDFFKITTSPIRINHDEKVYDLGQYDIYIQADGIGRMGLYQLHFIPLEMPLAGNRHMHHYAGHGEMFDTIEEQFSSSLSTCFGSFNSFIYQLVEEFDFITLIRNLILFTSRYNHGSPYVYIYDLPFAKVTNA